MANGLLELSNQSNTPEVLPSTPPCSSQLQVSFHLLRCLVTFLSLLLCHINLLANTVSSTLEVYRQPDFFSPSLCTVTTISCLHGSGPSLCGSQSGPCKMEGRFCHFSPPNPPVNLPSHSKQYVVPITSGLLFLILCPPLLPSGPYSSSCCSSKISNITHPPRAFAHALYSLACSPPEIHFPLRPVCPDVTFAHRPSWFI